MSLAEELDLINEERVLAVSSLNRIVQGRIDEVADFIASTDSFQQVFVSQAPVSEELGNRFSRAIVSNPNINAVTLMSPEGVAMRELIRWIASSQTLVHMPSLEKVAMYDLYAPVGMSLQDWDFVFSLLITSTSLQELDILFKNGCHDDFMRAFPRFLLDASTLVSFSFTSVSNFPEASYTSLFESVAQSSLRTFQLYGRFTEAVVQAVAECFAQAIAESSALEQVGMGVQMRLALSLTTPVRNLDFTLSHVGDESDLLFKINRRWKPLLRTNVPLGLWPHILEKAHVSPETCIHGPEGILFLLLREKADLIPCSAGLVQNCQLCDDCIEQAA
jgi:hypothetical protein